MRMKKIVISGLLILSMLGLTACSSSKLNNLSNKEDIVEDIDNENTDMIRLAIRDTMLSKDKIDKEVYAKFVQVVNYIINNDLQTLRLEREMFECEELEEFICTSAYAEEQSAIVTFKFEENGVEFKLRVSRNTKYIPYLFFEVEKKKGRDVVRMTFSNPYELERYTFGESITEEWEKYKDTSYYGDCEIKNLKRDPTLQTFVEWCSPNFVTAISNSDLCRLEKGYYTNYNSVSLGIKFEWVEIDRYEQDGLNYLLIELNGGEFNSCRLKVVLKEEDEKYKLEEGYLCKYTIKVGFGGNIDIIFTSEEKPQYNVCGSIFSNFKFKTLDECIVFIEEQNYKNKLEF